MAHFRHLRTTCRKGQNLTLLLPFSLVNDINVSIYVYLLFRQFVFGRKKCVYFVQLRGLINLKYMETFIT